MVPKTKLQKKIVSMSKKLKELSAKQKKWALLNCLDHTAIRNKGGRISCLDCGHQWKSESTQGWHDEILGVKCPKCKTDLKLKQTQERVFFDRSSLNIIEEFQGFQVIRYYELDANYKSGEKRNVRFNRCSEIWISPEGKFEVIAKLIGGFNGNFNGEFELRNRKSIDKYSFNAYKIYPEISFIPELERNGFNGKCHGIPPFRYMRLLLTEPKFETIVKAEQISLVRELRNSRRIFDYWSHIKICIKNNYIVDDAGIWKDYIDLLKYYKKDIMDPKLICPKDLKKSHNIFVERKRKTIKRLNDIQRNKDIKELIRKKKEDALKYKKRVIKYFDLKFVDGDITVEVFKTIDQVEQEGILLKHCVFTNGYHNKQNSLILSARYKNVPVETVELYINSLTISQSRGYDNENSEYHDKIVKLVNNNMPLIKKVRDTKPKKKRKLEFA